MESAQLTNNEVKTVEVDGNGVKHNLRIPSVPEIRTSHGLFLTLDIESKNLIFNEANWARMQRSSDVNVILFRTMYADVLPDLAEGETVMGIYNPMVPPRAKTPVPCLASWGLTQMFQQRVKKLNIRYMCYLT